MSSTYSSVRRENLRADCNNCFALCCTAFGFSRSVDFAEDKPAGSPCRHLGSNFSCSVHKGLRSRGFRGCTVFDCFGAGQVVSQQLFSGVSWRERPDTQRHMFSAFKIVKQLHEMLWYLIEAQERTYDPDTAHEAHELASTIAALVGGGQADLFTTDIDAIHRAVRAVLMEISAEVRASYFAEVDRMDTSIAAEADLAGSDLRAHRLCGADLRGACLIAVDLRGSDLTAVDLLGADLRDARLDGADLSAALFVTQPQVNAAKGSGDTSLPAGVAAPPHWLVR